MAAGYKTGIATGVLFSLGAALLQPLWRPALVRWGRPAAKGAIKGSLAAYELTRERVAVLGEHTQDLVAEAQMERATERVRGAAALATRDDA